MSSPPSEPTRQARLHAERVALDTSTRLKIADSTRQHIALARFGRSVLLTAVDRAGRLVVVQMTAQDRAALRSDLDAIDAQIEMLGQL